MIFNMTCGGTSLNFKVVGGTTEPSNTKENTIWVKTEKINNWYFSATQPEEMQEWDIWFQTGTESDLEFNALKKNGIQVYPLSATQYVGGKLVEVDASVYRGGEWVEFVSDLYLYKAGDQCTNVTGGYTTAAKSHSSGVSTNPSKPTVTNNAANMRIQQPTNSSGVCYTEKKIDLREYDELVFDGTIYALDDEKCWLCIWSSMGTNCMDNVVATIKSTGSSAEGVRTLNISSLNSSSGYHIGFYLFSPSSGSASYVKMNNLYLK